MVTICTASLTFNNSPFCPHSVFMYFVWIWEQTAIISLYSINWLVCINETKSVYCAVRTVFTYTSSEKIQNSSRLPILTDVSLCHSLPTLIAAKSHNVTPFSCQHSNSTISIPSAKCACSSFRSIFRASLIIQTARHLPVIYVAIHVKRAHRPTDIANIVMKTAQWSGLGYSILRVA